MHNLSSDKIRYLECLKQDVWRQICYCAEGLSVAPAIRAMGARGIWSRLAAAGPVPCDALLAQEGGNPGFIAGIFRALALQGRLTPPHSPSGIGFTSQGRQWFAEIATYQAVDPLLPLCQALVRPEGCADARLTAAAQALDDLGSGGRVDTEMLSFLAAPALLYLFDNAAPQPFAPAPLPVRHLTDFAPWMERPLILAALGKLGWVAGDEREPVLTVAGRMALAFADQFRYPLAYLSTQEVVGQLLFGDASAARGRTADGVEVHLNRKTDIQFSAEVYAKSCAPSLLETVLPLFAGGADAPQVIVDVGCGEAHMLAHLHREIAERGGGTEPLLVGVENNPVALEAAAATLGRVGAPFMAVAGDISDPAGLAAELAGRGVDLAEALHVNKSVIHDRELALADLTHGRWSSAPGQSGPYAAPDGSLVSAAAANADLTRLLRSWRPYLRRFGMVALEPFATPVATAVRHAGRTLVVAMEALHGLSCQYLCERGDFHAAARDAGLEIASEVEIGASQLGHNHMSCMHLKAV